MPDDDGNSNSSQTASATAVGSSQIALANAARDVAKWPVAAVDAGPGTPEAPAASR